MPHFGPMAALVVFSRGITGEWEGPAHCASTREHQICRGQSHGQGQVREAHTHAPPAVEGERECLLKEDPNILNIL